jgi:hypothetical protein
MLEKELVMRTLNVVGTLSLAAALMVVAHAPASSAPVVSSSAAAGLEAAPVATQVRFHQRYVGGLQPWGWVVAPYGWYDAYDNACSGDHPPWASEYAGYPDFWCSPGFSRYYRHWPQS